MISVFDRRRSSAFQDFHPVPDRHGSGAPNQRVPTHDRLALPTPSSAQRGQWFGSVLGAQIWIHGGGHAANTRFDQLEFGVTDPDPGPMIFGSGWDVLNHDVGSKPPPIRMGRTNRILDGSGGHHEDGVAIGEAGGCALGFWFGLGPGVQIRSVTNEPDRLVESIGKPGSDLITLVHDHPIRFPESSVGGVRASGGFKFDLILT